MGWRSNLIDRQVYLAVMLGMSLASGCSSSSFEWYVHLGTITEDLKQPHEPAEARRHPDDAEAQRERLVPLKWRRAQEDEEVAFKYEPYFGTEIVRSSADYGVDASGRTSATVVAKKYSRGRKLRLEACTLRGRFHHRALAEATAILQFELAAKSLMVIRCSPHYASDLNRNPAATLALKCDKGPPADQSAGYCVIGLDPHFEQVTFLQMGPAASQENSRGTCSLVLTHEPARNGELKSAIAEWDTSDQLYLLHRSDVQQHTLPAGSVLMITVSNYSDSEMVGQLTFNLFCFNDWQRDHPLFTKSSEFGNQDRIWKEWAAEWGQAKSSSSAMRTQSMTLDISVGFEPDAGIAEYHNGRPISP